jgi:hypothetical protein
MQPIVGDQPKGSGLMTWKTTAAAAALCAAASIGPGLPAAGRVMHLPDGARVKVLAELFTSEGCSSCPPADALLRRLLAMQPLQGIDVVALSNHVDYWNGLGWRDPFSSPLFSKRQSAYQAAVFHSGRIYTPQLVVDGFLECVANDAAAVRRAILEAAVEPKGTVSVSVRSDANAKAGIMIHVQVPVGVRREGSADIVVALTEDGLVSRVERGENGGRTLSHDAVVRLLTTVGHLDPQQRQVDLSTAIALDPSWKAGALRVVAFVQEAESRRIVAVGSSPFPSSRRGPHFASAPLSLMNPDRSSHEG